MGEGYMKYPTSYNSQSRFEYNNRVEFGQTCQQYYVNIDGHTEVSEHQREQITAYYNEDKTVTISTPSSRINHSGKTVEIEEKGWADGSHCGLCGDYNNDRRADLKSPKKCI